MKPKFNKKILFALLTAVVLVAAYAVYSRPLTIAQRYPTLSDQQCTEVRGYYRAGTDFEGVEFSFQPGSPEFEQICALVFEQEYRRTLRDLLPRGTRTHQVGAEDYQWELHFCFEDVGFPDGSRGSGTLLQVHCWYGQLDLYFVGEPLACRTADQDAWADAVFLLIR